MEGGEIDLLATDVAAIRISIQEGAGTLKITFSFADDLYLALSSATADAVVQRLQNALNQARGERGQ